METRFSVWLTPKAREDKILGRRDDALRVQVAAPPADGQANEALLRLLAQELGVSSREVRLVAGHRSRRKLVVVDGLTKEEVQARLGS